MVFCGISRALNRFKMVLVTAFLMTIFSSFAQANLSCSALLLVKQQPSFFVRSPGKLNSVIEKVSTAKEAELFVEQLHQSLLRGRLKLKFSHIRIFKRGIRKWLSQISADHLMKVFIIIREGGLYHLEYEFLKSFEEAIGLKLDEFSGGQLATIVNLFGKVKTQPTESFLKRLEDALLEKTIELDVKNLVEILSGYAHLGVKPSRVSFRVWFEKLKNEIEGMGPRHLSELLYSLNLMKEFESLKGFLRVVPEATWAEFRAPSHIRILSLIEQYSRVVLRVNLLELAPFKGAFKELVKSPSQESQLERDAAFIFDAEGVVYLREFQTTPGFYVDFYIPAKNRVVQVDGPHHYIISYEKDLLRKLRPQDILIDEVLKSHGYEVERLSDFDIQKRKDELESQENQEGFIGLFGGFKPNN
ncbi:MAG: hypothetical protein ACRBBP_08750 [Bdellovibrionales bacterium]